jgi:Sulfotransferase family
MYGWACDTDRPEASIKVTTHLNGRPVAEALAVYYRPDVAERLDCSGSHGFYISLGGRGSHGENVLVDVRLPDGSILEGAPIQARIPPEQPRTHPTLLFMHLAKTAGTSLRETFLLNHPQSEIIYVYPHPPGFPVASLRDLPLEQRARCRIVVGHFQYGVHELIPNDSLYFTIVRDPAARILSHYAHMTRHQSPVVVQRETVLSLEELLESKATANLDNLMVRCFAGICEDDFPPGTIDRDVYDLARHHLKNAFAYVGHQERLGSALQWLQAKFGFQERFDLVRLNCASRSEKSPRVRDEKVIRHFNNWDWMLYEDILALFP